MERRGSWAPVPALNILFNSSIKSFAREVLIIIAALSLLQVSWVRRRGEELHLLTIGLDTYASDSRFSLAFEKPNDWRLLLRSATERDAGLYECQVSAHPPLIRTVHLAVSGK